MTSLFDPFTMKGLTFKNRVIRSSLGGKLAYFDGTVSNAWANFERHFAESGVAALVSATCGVNDKRVSPVGYPLLSRDEQIRYYAKAIKKIKAAPGGVNYILQLGDAGAHTQASVLSQPADSRSSSAVLDGLYGYTSLSTAMTEREIAASVTEHAHGVRRAREAGADGAEITISKGYLLHQFLNPGVNRRRDGYGGSRENRFRIVREVVQEARALVGPKFLLGVRLSAQDYNMLPVNVRLPPRLNLRDWLFGNTLEDTRYFAKELESLGVDYLHVSQGYGFINPKENPGDFPLREVKIFANTVRHLSFKASLRATFLNVTPDVLLRLFMGIGWKQPDGENIHPARELKEAVSIPVIINGGFQRKSLMERALNEGKCDFVSLARPLLANADLLTQLRNRDEPENPCTFCNRCSVLTAVQPVGCYDRSRFGYNDEEMERRIVALTGNPAD